MAVVRKTFSGTVSGSGIQEYVNFTGIASEDSETRVSTNVEMTLHFLNSLCQTLIEAGYEDTTVNEEGYYITIFGEHIYFSIDSCTSTNGSEIDFTYFRGNRNFTSPRSYLTYNKTINYGIVIRGDKDHISIYIQTCKSINTLEAEIQFLHIFKMNNVLNKGESILFINNFRDPGSTYPGIVDLFYVKEKNKPYDFSLNNLTNTMVLSSNYIFQGNSSFENYIVTPMLCFYGNYLIPSMIGCSKPLFTTGKYYKIGENTYYCEGGSLYKID